MPYVNWRRYRDEFETLAQGIKSGEYSNRDITTALRTICRDDSALDEMHLGTESFVVSFLEFLFFSAEGPYSPGFLRYAPVIESLIRSSDNLRLLINHNAANALSNMVLNKRGKLKFSIADSLELTQLLDWWVRFGLTPVNRREVFDAALLKPTIPHRLTYHDPGLLIRLAEVFPEYLDKFWPDSLTYEEAQLHLETIAELPSRRRYRHVLNEMIQEGYSLQDVIAQEESRILPVQIRRKTFLAYLVKKQHNDTCQICNALGCTATSKAEKSVITVHHIVPLSQGGEDIASNMLVVCSRHHKAIHAGTIQVTKRSHIQVICPNKTFILSADNQHHK
jgi:hypothetical protein